jgi:signal transduction histidine kinase/DNA-binding NarL/FixJ family response regulator
MSSGSKWSIKKFPSFPVVVGGLFLSALLLMLSCGAGPGPGVVNGVLDLRSWDPQAAPIVRCAGNWKFAWNESRPECASPGWDDSSWPTIAVPDSWQQTTGTPLGYGWYRLHITNNRRTRLGLYLKNSNTAYALYVNGAPVAAMGRPGASEVSSSPGVLPRLVALPDAGEYTIAIFNSNFDDVNGGLTSAPQIGEVTVLAEMIKTDAVFDAFILGICFLVTAYFFIVWLLRRQDRTSLFFALFCLTNLVRMLTFNYNFMTLFQPFDIYDLRMRFQYLSLAPGAIFFLMFLGALFPSAFKARFFLVLKIAAIALALFTLAAPVVVFSRCMLVYHALLVVTGAGIAVALVRAARRREKGAAVILTGFVILFLTMVNDLIGANLGSYDLALEQYGMVLFIGIQAVMLAARSAQAFRTSEHLSTHLQDEVRRQTEKIEAQNRDLVRLNEERTNFFINFLHETKTPLTNIHNYLGRFLQRHGLTEDTRVIRNNVDKLRRDMTNLFDLEKLNRGRGFYDHRDLIDCSAFVKEKVKLFRETARLERIRLKQSVADKVSVPIDPAALDRIMNNLIENAIRYNRPGGTVAVALDRRDDRVRLTVTNTGPGIPADRIAHVFEPYYQITHAKQNLQGIGVGLSIVKKIVDDLGAEISVSSGADRETVFTVLFPAPHEARAVAKKSRASAPTTVPRKTTPVAEEYRDDRFTILIVEDNAETLVFLQQSLAARFNVFTAVNGRQALKKIRTIPRPHLVISDIMMDDMDGYALYDALAREEVYTDIPFIFLTAKSSQAEKVEGLHRGAIHYIPKPFDIEEVTAAVESLLAFLRKKIEKEKRLIREKVIGKLSAVDARAIPCPPGGPVRLSLRERQVTAFIVRGYQNKEISDCLEIATRTVDKHIEHIYKKYNVQNRIGLVRIMMDDGGAGARDTATG